MMSAAYSNRNSNNSSNSNSTDSKNETVQTIPERDITLCSAINNQNIVTSNSTTATIRNQFSQQQQVAYNSQMNQQQQQHHLNDNNINYLNSNLNKISINNQNTGGSSTTRSDYQLNAYFNSQHEFLQQQQQQQPPPQQQHFDNYNNMNYNNQQNNNKNYMMSGQLPYQRSFHDRDDLNYTNTSTSSTAVHFDPLNNITNNITIDRLRTRVLLLEQQISGANGHVNKQQQQHYQQQQQQSPVNLMELRMKELEAQAGDLKFEYEKVTSNNTRIQKLEEILCQREYEIEEMLKKFKIEKGQYEQEIVKLKQNTEAKEEELIEFRTQLTNSQKEYDLLKLKNREFESYIQTLPTKDELDEAKMIVKEAKAENERLKNEALENEKRVKNAKKYIKQKVEELKALEDKLRNSELEKEAIQREYDRFRELSKSVDELIDLRKENSKVNAELECARKLMSAHREQVNALQAKHQEEVYKLKEQIRLENELTIALREEVESKEKSLNEIKSTVKELSSYNQCLINNSLDLNSKITSYETVMNTDYQKLLKKLCKELDISKNKLKILVDNCICIYEGKDFNTALLISDVGVNYAQYEDADQIMTGVLTPDYLRTALNDLKTLQEKIDMLRLSVSTKFAEKLGGDCTACSIQ